MKSLLFCMIILFFVCIAVQASEVPVIAPDITELDVLPSDTHISISPSSDIPESDTKAGNLTEPDTNKSSVISQLANLSLSFIPNEGQTDKAVRFQVKSSGSTFFFTDDGVVMSAPGSDNLSAPSVIRQRFVHSDTIASVKGIDPLPGTANFLTGSDPSAWKTNLTTFRGVLYENLYPGIDLIYRGKEGRLKREFRVASGADPSLIQIGYEGAKQITVEPTGGLNISTGTGLLFESPLVCYQNISGKEVPVRAEYVVKDGTQVGFVLGEYDPEYPVIIDPDLVYSTYLGGSGDEKGMGIAVENGYAYVTGYTSSTDYPMEKAYQGTNNGNSDIFVTKLNTDGSGLVYSTFLGGSGDDNGNGIIVDNGYAYVAGYTTSTNFPVEEALQTNNNGKYDAFVTKLKPDGSGLVYSTYLGGSGDDNGKGIAVENGNAYVTGDTASTNFPQVGAYQTSLNGYTDAFVTKLKPDGSGLEYSIYLGGNWYDYGYAIAVDNGFAYVTGRTFSNDFSRVGAYQISEGGMGDAFVTKLKPDGSGLMYSTYLGGWGSEYGNAIAVDNGFAYVTGETSSENFPVYGAYQTSMKGYEDAFVTKLNTDGSGLMYSTYLGGNGEESGQGISIDGMYATITGFTRSDNYPITPGVSQSSNKGSSDAFVTKLNTDGSGLEYSTYLGGNGWDVGYAITVNNGYTYVTGRTQSTDFPKAGEYQNYLKGSSDAFITKLTLYRSGPIPGFTVNQNSGPAPLTVKFTDTSTGGTLTEWDWNYGDGSAWFNTTDSAQKNPEHTYANAGTYTATLVVKNAAGENALSKQIIVSASFVAPVAAFTTSTNSGTTPLTVQFTDTSTGNPTSWAWTFGDGGISTEQNPSHQYTSAGTFTATLVAKNSAGQSTKSSTITVKSGNVPINPKITSMKPTSGQQGGKAAVTITGSNFEKNAVKVTVSGKGVTIGKYKTRTTNKIVVPFTIAKNAKTGARTVMVTNPSSGLKATKKFTITAAPKITKITPTSGKQGKTVKVTITGKNFEKGKSTVNFGKGVSVTKYVTRNADKIVANIKIASSAKVTKRTVTVKNPTWGVSATAKTKFSVLKAKGTSTSQIEPGSSISNGVLSSPVLSSSLSASSPKNQAQLNSGLNQVIPPAVV